MHDYLIARNEESKVYGLDTVLLRRTERGVFEVSVTARRQPVRFLHILERVCDWDASMAEIAERLLSLPNQEGKSRTGRYTVEPLKTPIGHRIGRIRRPVHGFGAWYATDESDDVEQMYSQIKRQTVHIYEKLLRLSDSIDLHQTNLNVFSNETRDLIIISCLQVESLFKLLMYEDVHKSKGNMAEYWNSSKHAQLSDYELRFTEAYGLGTIKPFAVWSPPNTEYRPLPWYKAYNELKHNSLAGNSIATLSHAIEAIAACSVLQTAISPPRLVSQKLSDRINKAFEQAFVFVSQPSWSPGDHYWALPSLKLRFLPVSG